jgi:catechol 2,3-dioxygenase-like lactoylglutathione lyase family enzyme
MSLATGASPVTFVLTRDRALTLPFYRDVLGLPLVSEDPFAAVFDLGGVRLRLTTVERHVPSGHTVLGWSVPDIRAAMAALKAKGVTFAVYEGFGQDADGLWTAPGNGTAQVCWFHDPEGNNLSLTSG